MLARAQEEAAVGTGKKVAWMQEIFQRTGLPQVLGVTERSGGDSSVKKVMLMLLGRC